jgi:hypothetical protein
MLTLVIPALELYDEKKAEFITHDETTLELEHSLVSLSKWESKWEKPFLGPDEKTSEETLDYIKCMTLTPDVDPEVYDRLNNGHLDQINTYISAKMSATWFSEPRSAANGKAPVQRSREIITAEIIYYWIVAHNLNWEVQYWHLNRLFTLVKVCNQKNAPEKQQKRPKRDMVAERQRLNAERKAAMQTKG